MHAHNAAPLLGDPPTADALLSLGAVERALGRSHEGVYRLFRAGRLPRPQKLGGRSYWREADVEALIADLDEESSCG